MQFFTVAPARNVEAATPVSVAERTREAETGAEDAGKRSDSRQVALACGGLIGILLSLYLWGNLSTVSEWMLGFLFGILLVVEGTALSSLAWRVRREI